ncbi:MAG: nucleotide exchange factor GrpE [Chthoniobacteraceae bacterium]
MSEPAELPEADLDTQLRGLFEEAELKIQGRTAPKADAEKEASRLAEERAAKAYTTLPQMLRPMVLGLEAISRATGENAQILQRLDRSNSATTEAQKSLPQLIAGLESLLDQKNGVSQRMFDALHEELKDYKDGFLLESILKPIIRDLVSLYDDLTTIHRQMEECVAASSGAGSMLLDRLQRMETNLAHHCEFVVEILARLEVTVMPISSGRLDKQAQRAVAVELVDDPELDMMVVRTVKRGFMWKARILRPEEVVVNKCKQAASSGKPDSLSVAQ